MKKVSRITSLILAAILSFCLVANGSEVRTYADTKVVLSETPDLTEGTTAENNEETKAEEVKKTKSFHMVGERLGVEFDKLWITGEGTLEICVKDRKKGEDVTLTTKSSNKVEVTKGKFDADGICTISIKVKKAGTEKLTVKFGDEEAVVELKVSKKQALTAEEVYKKSHDAMVEIKTVDSQGSVYIGSGFFVGDGLILSNEHVVANASKIEIYDYNGKTYKIKDIAKISVEKDLILFRVKTGNKQAFSLAKEGTVGSTIYSLGSPTGLTGIYNVGMISNAEREVNGTGYFQMSMSSATGCGGGPIINKYGEAIGVMTLTITAGECMTMAINGKECIDFVRGICDEDTMTLKELYARNKGRVKESNDYNFFESKDVYTATSALYKDSNEVTPEDICKNSHDAIVEIRVLYANDTVATGTGFFIDESTVITCRHLFSNGVPVTAIALDFHENTYTMKTLWISPEADIAKLELIPDKKGTEHTWLEIAPDYIPEPGETVYSYGNPAGYWNTFAGGIVSISSASVEGTDNIINSAATESGNSGSPLLNKYGQVIGVNSAKASFVPKVNISLQIKYINTIAEEPLAL